MCKYNMQFFIFQYATCDNDWKQLFSVKCILFLIVKKYKHSKFWKTNLLANVANKTTEAEEDESGCGEANPPNKEIPVKDWAALIDNYTNSVRGSEGKFFLNANH